MSLHGVTHLDGSARMCAAHNRAGEPCGKPATPGTTVCAAHGSKAPQVRTAAAERLLAAVDPAITELLRIMRKGDTDTVKLRAVEAILDRTGYPRSMTVGGGMSEGDAKAALVAALIAARDARLSGPSA